MKRILRLLQWLLKAAVLFTLFAFALNNQHETRVNFFFGQHWQASTNLVVLASLTLGVVIGVLGMVPRWWRQRSAARAAPVAEGMHPTPEPPPSHGT